MNEEGKRGHARSDSFGEIFGSLASLDGRVLSSHVAGMEDPATELASVGRKVVWVDRLACDTTGVGDDLFVWSQFRQRGMRERRGDSLFSVTALTTCRHME
jgi:hypothetical protein